MLGFDVYSDASSRSSSPDSFVSSGDEADFGPNATALDMQSAYFSSAEMPADQPNTFGRQFLRKQETAYTNRPAGENVLPLPARASFCSDTRDQHGLAEDDREVVGYVLDPDSGQPVAEWVEELPPPPNKNYSHWHKQNGGLLNRAMGYDPHVVYKKKETEGVLNPADPINGDAQLSSTRIAEVSERQEIATWNSRTHQQAFAEQDSGRDQYDGLNPKLSAPQRVLTKLQHSWRETQPPPQAPLLPTYNNSVGPAHPQRTLNRKESGPAFWRRPAVGRSVVQLDSVMDIPLATVKTQREKENESATTTTATSMTAMRAVITADVGRVQKDPEIMQKQDRASITVEQASVRADQPQTLEQMREGVVQTNQGISHIPASAAITVDGQREGSEDAELVRIEAVYTSNLGESAMAREGEREGGEATSLSRAADAAGGGNVAAVRKMHGDQSRDLREDTRMNSISPTAMLHSLGNVVHASATASGIDAIRVDTTRAQSNVMSTASTATATETAPTKRTTHVSHAPFKSKHKAVGNIIRMNEDRIPFDDSATFVFGGSVSETGRVVGSSTDGMQRDRAKQVSGSANAQSHTTSAYTRASVAPSRSNSGSYFGPERLKQTHNVSRTRLDQRINGQVSFGNERSTPVTALLGTDTPLNPSIQHGHVQTNNGRETPQMRALAPSPAVLRG